MQISMLMTLPKVKRSRKLDTNEYFPDPPKLTYQIMDSFILMFGMH